MLKRILFGLLVIIVVFCIVAAMQPSEFTITRSATFNAPASALFTQVNDLHRWNDWSPWAKLDPNAKNSFNGPEAGVGASMHWAGNSDVGEGTMTITDSRPDSFVGLRLEFLKPFQAVNTTEFTIEPEGDISKLTWSMKGTKNFVAKAMGLIMDCDKMVGGQFEQGLANLKGVVEAKP